MSSSSTWPIRLLYMEHIHWIVFLAVTKPIWRLPTLPNAAASKCSKTFDLRISVMWPGPLFFPGRLCLVCWMGKTINSKISKKSFHFCMWKNTLPKIGVTIQLNNFFKRRFRSCFACEFNISPHKVDHALLNVISILMNRRNSKQITNQHIHWLQHSNSSTNQSKWQRQVPQNYLKLLVAPQPHNHF